MSTGLILNVFILNRRCPTRPSSPIRKLAVLDLSGMKRSWPPAPSAPHLTDSVVSPSPTPHLPLTVGLSPP